MSYNRGKNWKKRNPLLEIDCQGLMDVIHEKYNSNIDSSKPDLSKVIECTPLSDLDSELKERIQNQLDVVPIYSGECHLTSWIFSGMSPKINSVKGWGISECVSFEEFLHKHSDSRCDEFKIDFYKKMDDRWIKGEMDNQIFWYDTKTNRYFYVHSWNELNGVHFDVQSYCSDEFNKETRMEDDIPKKTLCIPMKYTSTSELFDREKEFGFPIKGTNDGCGLLEWFWNLTIKDKLEQCETNMTSSQTTLYTLNRFKLNGERILFSPYFENRIKINGDYELVK